MESVADMVSRLDSMASCEPSCDLSNNDVSALKHALQFVPGSDFYKPPATENQCESDSASTNKQSVPFIKCDICSDIATVHLCNHHWCAATA